MLTQKIKKPINLSNQKKIPFVEINPNVLNSKINSEKKYKIELCKSFTEIGFCKYGTNCRFAHGNGELQQRQAPNQNYKSKKCAYFHEKWMCHFGNRCLYVHDDRKLKDLKDSFFSFLMKNPELKETKAYQQHKRPRLAIFEDICAKEVIKGQNQLKLEDQTKYINDSFLD